MAIRLICILILFWGVSSVLRAPELSPAVALAEAGKAAAVADQEKKSSIIDQSAKKGLPTTLSPELFTGEVKAGYIIAQTIPDVLAELHCYCGCDKSVGHGNLLDCFVDSHAAG